MHSKILIVDDSKSIRTIIQKMLSEYNVDLFEAEDGLQGLEIAKKEKLNLILLDITMPTMDGIVMLKKLKEIESTRDIPIIMLSGESDKEKIVQIARIGIQDYIVKPFTEDLLTEKINLIFTLEESERKNDAPRKTLEDPCEIVIVEDKEAIIKQIQEKFSKNPWTFHAFSQPQEAANFCKTRKPDLVIVSLSLPNKGAFSLFDHIRIDGKAKKRPFLGLAIKTAIEEQNHAKSLGFVSIVTKPIDFSELESKICKAMQLDTSIRFFKAQENYLIVKCPQKASSTLFNEMSAFSQNQFINAVDSGLSKVIFDCLESEKLDLEFVKFLMKSMEECKKLSLDYALVGTPHFTEECKNFAECQEWVFLDSIEAAKK